MNRAIIIGNSGSGKSYLAAGLGARLALPVHELDDLFWEPGGFIDKRPEALVHRDIEAIKRTHQWIVEGVFGELAGRFVDSADFLIWLDMEWDYCRRNILDRGAAGYAESADERLQRLVTWASAYRTRDDARSYTGHKELFDNFRHHKKVLRSQQEVDRILADPSLLGLESS